MVGNGLLIHLIARYSGSYGITPFEGIRARDDEDERESDHDDEVNEWREHRDADEDPTEAVDSVRERVDVRHVLDDGRKVRNGIDGTGKEQKGEEQEVRYFPTDVISGIESPS